MIEHAWLSSRERQNTDLLAIDFYLVGVDLLVSCFYFQLVVDSCSSSLLLGNGGNRSAFLLGFNRSAERYLAVLSDDFDVLGIRGELIIRCESTTDTPRQLHIRLGFTLITRSQCCVRTVADIPARVVGKFRGVVSRAGRRGCRGTPRIG
jgi:hypothetical protein